jgi:SPP1 family predicted phage head-tail adaptor
MQNLKDKKVILYKTERIKDDEGFATTFYRPIHAGKLWAYFRHLSGNEFFASMTVNMKEEVLFSINWREDLNPLTNFISYKGIFYNITRIDTFEGYKQDIKLYATRMVSQPKPGEILEWVEK